MDINNRNLQTTTSVGGTVVRPPQSGQPNTIIGKGAGIALTVIAGIVLLGLLLLAAIVIAGLFAFRQAQTIQVGPTETVTQSIELGSAKSADVVMSMGVGSLTVRGGATNLMDADFTYNIPDWRPEVNYAVSLGDNTSLSNSPTQAVSPAATPGIGGTCASTTACPRTSKSIWERATTTSNWEA
jgi:hypothetical protein